MELTSSEDEGDVGVLGDRFGPQAQDVGAGGVERARVNRGLRQSFERTIERADRGIGGAEVAGPGSRHTPRCPVFFKYSKATSITVGAQTEGTPIGPPLHGTKAPVRLGHRHVPVPYDAGGHLPVQVGPSRDVRVGVRSRKGGNGGIDCDGRR